MDMEFQASIAYAGSRWQSLWGHIVLPILEVHYGHGLEAGHESSDHVYQHHPTYWEKSEATLLCIKGWHGCLNFGWVSSNVWVCDGASYRVMSLPRRSQMSLKGTNSVLMLKCVFSPSNVCGAPWQWHTGQLSHCRIWGIRKLKQWCSKAISLCLMDLIDLVTSFSICIWKSALLSVSVLVMLWRTTEIKRPIILWKNLAFYDGEIDPTDLTPLKCLLHKWLWNQQKPTQR